MQRTRLQIDVQRACCPYCKDVVRPGEDNVACKACMAWHHQECWGQLAACSTCRGQTALTDTPAATTKLCDHLVRPCKSPSCTEITRSETGYCQEHYVSAQPRGASIAQVLGLVAGVGAMVFVFLGALFNAELLLVCLPLGLLFCVAMAAHTKDVERDQAEAAQRDQLPIRRRDRPPILREDRSPILWRD